MRADDVGRHQIGRELNALRVKLEYLGERGDERRLAETGKSLKENVSAREDSCEHESVQRGASEQHRVERGERAVEVLLYRRYFIWG